MPTKSLRRKSSQRRTQIADAALRLIGERGIGALTMATLAEKVGVTAGALFRHFPSREAILDAAVTAAVDRLEQTFPHEEAPPLDRLLALARARIDAVRGEPGLAWLLLSDHAMHALPKAAVWKLEGLVRKSKRFLSDAIKQGVALGTIRSDIAPELLLLPVVGTIHMLLRAPGAHRAAFETEHSETEHSETEHKKTGALDALRLLLAPATTNQPKGT